MSWIQTFTSFIPRLPESHTLAHIHTSRCVTFCWFELLPVGVCRGRTHTRYQQACMDCSGRLPCRKTDGRRLVRSESSSAVNKLIYNRSLAGCDWLLLLGHKSTSATDAAKAAESQQIQIFSLGTHPAFRFCRVHICTFESCAKCQIKSSNSWFLQIKHVSSFSFYDLKITPFSIYLIIF